MARKPRRFLRRKPTTTTSSVGAPSSWRRGVGSEPLFRVTIEPEVAHRFNAYAAAAYPREIGGLLRVEDSEDGFRVTDIQLFEHKVATGSYFQLDGEEVSRFLLDLVRQGRKQEVGEWRSLIHSHPGFAPWPSGTDRDNLLLLAADRFAFSIICSAHPQPARNYYLVHYAQGGQAPLIVTGIQPWNDDELAGLGALSADAIETIGAEVQRFLPADPWPAEPRTWMRSRRSTLLSDELAPDADDTLDDPDEARLFADLHDDGDWQLGEDWQLPEPFADDARFPND